MREVGDMNSFFRTMQRWSVVAIAGAMASTPASSQPAEDFYRGRTIQMIIGAGIGGGYDLYARMLARTLTKHIPGNPSIVVQNMPAAGGLQAAAYIHSVAPKDGTVIAALARGAPLAPLLMDVRFDGRQFTWLGSVAEDVSVCMTSEKSKIRQWDDMLAHEFSLGGATSDLSNFALLIKNVFGAKARLVRGYKGTNDISIAMERGEVDGLCGISTSTIRTAFAQKIRDKQVFVIVQTALRKDPDWKHTPLLYDFARTDEQRAILRLILGSQLTGRPYAAPAGIPEDRAAVLISAFTRSMTDPEFVQATGKVNLHISPVNAAEMTAMVADGYATSTDTIEKAKAAIAN